MRCPPPTRASVERRTNQGLSRLDIRRCLKRSIAREIYHQLTSPPPTAATACPKQEASKLTSTDTTERNAGMLRRIPPVASTSTWLELSSSWSSSPPVPVRDGSARGPPG